MFWLGVLLGIAAACAVLWFLYGPDGVLRVGAVPLDPRHDIFDIERSAIDRMLAAEMAAGRAPGRPDDEDIIDGTAQEIVRRW
jgi:hypothetical protein